MKTWRRPTHSRTARNTEQTISKNSVTAVPVLRGGIHRYFFKVYALSEVLTLKAGITKAELLKAMEGKILAEGQLMGKYKR